MHLILHHFFRSVYLGLHWKGKYVSQYLLAVENCLNRRTSNANQPTFWIFLPVGICCEKRRFRRTLNCSWLLWLQKLITQTKYLWGPKWVQTRKSYVWLRWQFLDLQKLVIFFNKTSANKIHSINGFLRFCGSQQIFSQTLVSANWRCATSLECCAGFQQIQEMTRHGGL